MHWHWENLDQNGSGLYHGRAWWHLNEQTTDCLRIEWHLCSPHFAFGLNTSSDAEEVLKLRMCVPPIGIYLGLSINKLSHLLYTASKKFNWCSEYDWGGYTRELSLSIHNWAIWWNIWRNPFGGPCHDPRSGGWYPFGMPGARIGEPKLIEIREVEIPLPEGSYKARAARKCAIIRGSNRWHHPFGSSKINIIELMFETPVPIPGKGESSWDVNDDAILSSSGCHDTFEEAIGKFVTDILSRRRRYGGSNWEAMPIQLKINT